MRDLHPGRASGRGLPGEGRVPADCTIIGQTYVGSILQIDTLISESMVEPFVLCCSGVPPEQAAESGDETKKKTDRRKDKENSTVETSEDEAMDVQGRKLIF